MNNIAQQLKQVEQKIQTLEFDIAVERAVYQRLKIVDSGSQSSESGNTPRQTTPGSMPHHLEAVLINAGASVKVPALIKGVKERGAIGTTDKALENNVRGTLKRRTDIFVRVDRGEYDLKKRMEAQTEIAQE